MGRLDTPKIIQKWSKNCPLSFAEQKYFQLQNQSLRAKKDSIKVTPSLPPQKILNLGKKIVQTFEECSLSVKRLDAYAQHPRR